MSTPCVGGDMLQSAGDGVGAASVSGFSCSVVAIEGLLPLATGVPEVCRRSCTTRSASMRSCWSSAKASPALSLTPLSSAMAFSVASCRSFSARRSPASSWRSFSSCCINASWLSSKRLIKASRAAPSFMRSLSSLPIATLMVFRILLATSSPRSSDLLCAEEPAKSDMLVGPKEALLLAAMAPVGPKEALPLAAMAPSLPRLGMATIPADARLSTLITPLETFGMSWGACLPTPGAGAPVEKVPEPVPTPTIRTICSGDEGRVRGTGDMTGLTATEWAFCITYVGPFDRRGDPGGTCEHSTGITGGC
mmetsp:Transcript_73319/g.203409  ORF Transcript_73319/g.203409 Transcript_73319/m.203409 type:complete len:308 (-) Transcript_73319:104-1027(-)